MLLPSCMIGCAQEIQHAYHTNALLIKMLLAQAQAQGVELLVDTNALENEFLLKQVPPLHGMPITLAPADVHLLITGGGTTRD